MICKKHILALVAGVSVLFPAISREYYVSSVHGDDRNDGSLTAPYKTINRAAERMHPGDICYIREGVYHECVIPAYSGTSESPVVFRAYNDEKVILDGTRLVTGRWKRHRGNIYRTTLDAGTVTQLFVDTTMMIEARWPNLGSKDLFDRSSWGRCDTGSCHGKIVSEAVAASGLDFTGAQAYLNVAHQWWTWNREIKRHEKGSAELIYDADLVGLCSYTPQYMDPEQLEKAWADDYFYLFGVLAALDAEREWYFDPEKHELYFYAPGGVNPNTLHVRYKTLDYGLKVKDKQHVHVEGIDFFGCTFLFEDCDDCSIADANLKYPTYSRTITEYDQDRRESVITKIVGDRNVVDRISLSHANNMGLMVMGNHNKVRNSIIHDINWSGTLIYPARQLSSSPHLGVNWFNTIQYPPTERTLENSDVTSVGNEASRNTLYNCGGPILVYHASESRVEFNHLYDGGKASKDVSLIYGCWPFSHGSEICYNWVHGCQTDGYEGRSTSGGIGIRADDQSRRNYIHHNVVWDCGELGITVKGEDHMVYNNTVLACRIPILIPVEPEPYKEWAVRWPRLAEQNVWTRVFNNIANKIQTTRKPGDDLPLSENNFCNFTDTEQPPLVAPEARDFRPQAASELVDRGSAPDYAELPFAGDAPDLGAYEYGAQAWVPGATWAPDSSWLELLVRSK